MKIPSIFLIFLFIIFLPFLARKLFNLKENLFEKSKNSILFDDLNFENKTEIIEQGLYYLHNPLEIPQKNTIETVKLLEFIAENGHYKAFHKIGKFYEYGEGDLEVDMCLAKKYYQKSADYGIAISHLKMGLFNSIGKCGEQNQAKALIHFELANLNKSIVAKMILANRAYQGYNSHQSCEKAALYYENIAYQIFENESEEYSFSSKSIKKMHKITSLKEKEKKKKDPNVVEITNETDQKTIHYFNSLAEEGNAEAQNVMGKIYEIGTKTTPQNIDKAMEYYQKAADQEYVPALRNLAIQNLFPDNSKPQNISGLYLLLEAAYRNDTIAMNIISQMYREGLFVERNVMTALSWAQKSAERGDKDGQYISGMILLKEPELGHDYATAMLYFLAAASQKHPFSMYQIGKMYLNGLGVERKSCQQAVFWFKKVAESVVLQKKIIPVEEDVLQGKTIAAINHYEILVEMGFSKALFNLGALYENLDFDSMQKLFKNSPEFQQEFSEFLNNQKNSEKNSHSESEEDFIKKAIEKQRDLKMLKYYTLSAQQEHSLAIKKLGDIYFYGKAVEINYNTALRYYQLSSQFGNYQGSYSVGYIYENGFGNIEKNFDQALKFYNLAKSQNPKASLAINLIKIRCYFKFLFYRPKKAISTFLFDVILSNPFNSPHFIQKVEHFSSRINELGDDIMSFSLDGEQNDPNSKIDNFDLDFPFNFKILFVVVLGVSLVIILIFLKRLV
ncbi:sel-1-like protein [Anaeramoeba ignava]|uniref:Sel-1-like protein n=1 Tax=Anaeramoeba ignava TaxID=1746090 RepID=A0A9Q0R7N3_ANAIG|nr:sel-1-like protein [Anaeramoeba ignava]